MKLCDMHTHSDNSFDAKNTVDEMCRAAVDKGLYAIAITDHCEAPFIKYGEKCEFGNQRVLLRKSYKDACNAGCKYFEKLKVLCGIELAEPMHNAECTAEALSFGDYDFTLASLHNLRGEQDFYYFDFSKCDTDKILNMYFEELAETAEFEFFDSLAHITYPLRYVKSTTGVTPDLAPYQDKIDEIYKILINNNKALEINVSGLFKGLGSTLPDESQVKRFHTLGGKYVTIGTDAHETDFVGKGIETGIAIAKRAGFKHYTIYEKHQPVLIEIE